MKIVQLKILAKSSNNLDSLDTDLQESQDILELMYRGILHDYEEGDDLSDTANYFSNFNENSTCNAEFSLFGLHSNFFDPSELVSCDEIVDHCDSTLNESTDEINNQIAEKNLSVTDGP